MPRLKRVISAAVLGGALVATVACTQEALFTKEEKMAMSRIAKYRRCVRGKQLQPAAETQKNMDALLSRRFGQAVDQGLPMDLIVGMAEVEAADTLLQMAQEICSAQEGIGIDEINAQTRALQMRFGSEFLEKRLSTLEYTNPLG